MTIPYSILAKTLLLPLALLTPAIQRHYQEGEAIAYKMHGVNQSHVRTFRYDAHADATVKKNPSGIFIEEFTWSALIVNDQPTELTAPSRAFRQPLSLSPDYTLTVPDLSTVQPILIGPITDLLTFYADVQLAMRQTTLLHAGDHIYVKHGIPSSWADGTYVVFGQDVIDFDITLQSIDPSQQVATYIVRHVPPSESKIKFPAEWMQAPVSGTANNWIEVEKVADNKYTAEIGKETFEVVIRIAMPSGRILSATMDNPVEVEERDCTNAALTACGAPARYQIKRQISMEADPASSKASN